MARGSRKSSAAAETGNPQENLPEHRQFLIRSLERNDAELAALMILNQSLRHVKQQILEQCGELVLLDLGAGNLTLIKGGLHETKGCKHFLTPAQQHLCIDFLERMLLRRKLSNRLIRRLNRVAHAMDGESVQPPPPPRYGDLRLAVDPEALQARVDLWKRQEQAKKAIEAFKLRGEIDEEVQDEESKPVQVKFLEDVEGLAKPTTEEEPSPGPEAETLPKEEEKESLAVQPTSTSVGTKEDEAPSTKEEPTSTNEEMKDAEIPGAKEETQEQEKVEPAAGPVQEGGAVEDTEEDKTEVREDGPSEPKPMEVDSEPVENVPVVGSEMELADSALKADSPPSADEATSKPPEAVESAAPKNEMGDEPPKEQSEANKSSPPTIQEQYETLKEYDEAYEKVWDPTFTKFTYRIASAKEREEDYEKLISGAGVGAQARLVHLQEREQEHKRWQAALLAKIPDQPTLDELGLKNRVFCLEERRKRCLEDAEEDEEGENDGDSETGEPHEKKSKIGDEMEECKQGEELGSDGKMDLDSEGEDIEGDDSSKVSPSKKVAGKELRKKEEGDATDEEKDDEEKDDEENSSTDSPDEENEEEQVIEEPKRIRAMSLAAIPSFYDQDMKRLRLIHGDLMTQSILKHARSRLEAVTQDYNSALQRSTQLFAHRSRLTQNFQFFVNKSRQDLAKANQEYGVKVAIAKQNYLKEKREHDRQRMQSLLPTSFGRRPFGTQFIQTFMRNSTAPNTGVIATCLADVIDGAMMINEGKAASSPFRKFEPPPPPMHKQTGEPIAKVHAHLENQLRQQLGDLNTKLQQSEEDRKRCWKKYAKASSELEIPSAPYSRRLDPNAPMPPLQRSTQQAIPQGLSALETSMATYNPKLHPGPVLGSGGSDSKYSLAKVKERIQADGSVAPVTSPKRTEDGLYQRPAGRTRKGMQWDAVRGIWVPQGSF